MHKVTFVQVGKTKDTYIENGMDEFIKRLSRFVDLEIVTIAEGRFLVPGMIEREKREESMRIRSALEGRQGVLIYLDVYGKPVSSEEFSHVLEDYVYEGIPLIFLIGGAYGIDEEIVGGMIKMRISMSKMTFTHQMVRLIFLEQLYRAFMIMQKSPYHH